jgi:sn-glycerol 3-phosphate transport system substrate-binding protein
MTKKIFWGTAVLLWTVLFFSCDSRKGGSAASSERGALAGLDPANPVTISFWHSMTDDAGMEFENYIKEFNATLGAEKGIIVESVFQGQYSDATAKLRPLLQNKQGDRLPDVMQIDATGVVDYLNTEYAFTVDDALAVDGAYDLNQIIQAPLKAWSYGGRQLGIPVSASTTVMYYNKTLLDAAGIDRPPSTFDGIIETAGKLPALNANGQKITAFAQMPNSPLLANWIGQIPGQDAEASYIVDKRNGRDGTASKLVCDTEGTLLSFLRAWKRMYDAGALLNVSDGLNNLFLTQQIAFLTASTSNLSSLLTQIDNRFELGCAYFPRIDQASNFGATVSGAALFMFNKGDQVKTAAAWELVKFMSSAPIQARFSVATGYMPVNAGSYAEEIYTAYAARYPQTEVGSGQLNETSPDLMGITIGPSRDFYMEIMNQVSAMLTENKDPELAASSTAAALNLLLEDYIAANPD